MGRGRYQQREGHPHPHTPHQHTQLFADKNTWNWTRICLLLQAQVWTNQMRKKLTDMSFTKSSKSAWHSNPIEIMKAFKKHKDNQWYWYSGRPLLTVCPVLGARHGLLGPACPESPLVRRRGVTLVLNHVYLQWNTVVSRVMSSSPPPARIKANLCPSPQPPSICSPDKYSMTTPPHFYKA